MLMRTIAIMLLLTDAVSAADWVELNDLAKNWTTKGNWTVKDGAFDLTPRKGEVGWSRFNAYLWSIKKDYAEFECSFDYKVEVKGNSGFYFHVGDVADPVATGIEVQINDVIDPKAKLTDHHSGGIIIGNKNPGIPPSRQTAKPAGEWNTMLVSVTKDTLKVTLNGEVVNEVKLTEGKIADKPKTGSIGFQDHGLPLQIRKIKVK
jgi:hypothetical protein